ncbi:biogenesis protein MshI [Glaciecola sp. XM2]|jgi:MSHA biogenesis protein MshI|uniref:pilus assembly protein PilM n=1 Tax=Glaciecola sp. XM2 TaxID=1914931 RepID=UPI001BDEF379|nr:pilus assembly protein PilM [Glaciecola sp. XM2]MBT1451697.1 biogenesis protein MshI [Glaciecola sp. XM2]
MRISWKQYFKQKFRKSPEYFSVGIAFTAEQVLLCALKKTDSGLEWVLDASFTHQSWASALVDYVKEHNLQGTSCYFTLTAHWYKVHQVERPEVADGELLTALKWPMQEAIGSATEMVYDYANMPVQVSGQNKLMVVAIARKEIETLTRAIYDADLVLESISVEEFATMELTPNSKDAVITLVQEQGEDVVLNIVRDGQLFFSRRMKGFENIASFSQAELDMGITDSLTVQIQRSMDFFESQLRQPPVKRILIKLDTPDMAYICNSIAEAMGLPCDLLEPEIECGEHLNFKMASFSCLGAAYTKVSETNLIAEGSDESPN